MPEKTTQEERFPKEAFRQIALRIFRKINSIFTKIYAPALA
jgi:hypothetical protein